MDREIKKKATNYSLWLKVLLIILLIVAGIFGLRRLLRPNISHNDVIFSTATRGTLESTFSAVGIVKPLSEITITSPISTKIKAIQSENGKSVQKGDLILKLDTDLASLEYTRLHDELKLKENNVKRLRLSLNKNIKDIELDNKIQELEIQNLNSKLLDLKQLLSVGGVTEEEVKQAQSNLKIVELRKRKLENELAFRKASIDVDLKNEQIQSTIQRNKLNELGSKIKQTNVTSPINGVITWINSTIGEQVASGTPIAKVADLSKYYIEATASDMHAKKISLGQRVNITINQEIISGEIEQILPNMEQGSIQFKIKLDDPNDSLLRPNMKVELHVITDKKPNALFVLNGRAYKGGKKQFFFIKSKEDLLVKKELTIGLTNSKHIEILSGIQEGDQVVISDVERFKDHETIKFSEL